MSQSKQWPQEVLLHDHGDGSITVLPILRKLYSHACTEFPLDKNRDLETLHKQVKDWFFNPQIDIVRRFSLVTEVLKSYSALSMFAEQYVNYRAEQGFKYCEMTFAPQYHVNEGFPVQHVVDALLSGIRLGERNYPEIEVNLLLTIGREVEPQEAV